MATLVFTGCLGSITRQMISLPSSGPSSSSGQWNPICSSSWQKASKDLNLPDLFELLELELRDYLELLLSLALPSSIRLVLSLMSPPSFPERKSSSTILK